MTVRHVVLWRLASTDDAERAQHAARIKRELEALPAIIPGIERLEVSRDVVGGGNADLALLADFTGLDALAGYQSHPEHRRAGAFITSVTVGRTAADWLV